MNCEAAATKLSEWLGPGVSAVAIAFGAAAPAGVGRIDRAGPAGCAYWKMAAEGHVFYTEADDHYNCPVGAHTHGIELPSARAAELDGVVKTMVGLEYVRMEEVATLPRVPGPFRVAMYSPLAKAPAPPDVVVIRGTARQIMLVAEAANAAGIARDGAALGRPACAMIPAAMRSAQGNTSLGCIGNRVYTGLADAELYFTIPGSKLDEVVDKLSTIARANRELQTYHEARRQSLGAARA